MEEQKDGRLKYLEIPESYKSKAMDVNLWVKQSQRTCEMLAKHLAKQKPKTSEEFERVEFLKEFVLKTSQSNEKVLALLDFITGFLNEVMADGYIYQSGAVIMEQMAMQSDYIADLNKQTSNLKELYDIWRKNTPTT